MFSDDIKIKTPNGDKLIRHIKIGDMVYLSDNTIGKVIAVNEPIYKTTYALVCGNKSVIYTTLQQPILTSDGVFKAVEELHIGCELNGVGKISTIAESGERKCYGLVIDGNNTYIANGFTVKGE